MVVLAIGDVCAQTGLDFLLDRLPGLKKRYGADLTVVNGENSAPGGTGINRDGAARIFAAGADVVTTGNHAFDARGFEDLFDRTPALIRPMNLGGGVPGAGFYRFDLGYCAALVVNLMGRAFMQMNPSNCYDAMDGLLKIADTPVVIVDFHAETTSEKIAFARNYDGRVSLVFGTHTHVATADETVFPGGAAYISDVGMTGARESVIGVDIERAIKKQRYSLPVRFVPAGGPAALSGVAAEIDHKTGKARAVERVAVFG